MGKTATQARYSVAVADDRDTVRAAQRLRNDVFGLERPGGVDIDPYDELCDHIVVRAGDEVVGTYRLLPPGRADRVYSEGEFDLGALAGVRADLVEAGRSCVHPAHRSGAVITLLWGALARYVLLSGHRWLAGCASVSLADGPDAATATWSLAQERHLSPPELRVRPYQPWTPPGPPSSRPPIPPLIQGYLRLGAWVCGPPAHDADFGTADLFVLLSMDRVHPRYLEFFLAAQK
ncbi:GNAT family N-acetyltransferase [Kutzneria kofuensis]|uniref:Putative hemolysin n=1 Tax=Kutzneria kofuensis TaxID=103725 RepID=A0A7W9NHT0_9PSEU|nr:GNAT family N-acyltransferase [Kutzneria kofuensis]MBB5892869.1 putative hemolysin [Kutzneria kofuensis]